MIPLFESAPKYCPDCGHSLKVSNSVDGFDLGNVCNCSVCGFEYAKNTEPPDPGYPICETHGDYFYASSQHQGCAVCDLLACFDQIKALEAIIETDKDTVSKIREQLRIDIVEMIREEARAAVLEAYNMPLDQVLQPGAGATRIVVSAEQMDADRLEILPPQERPYTTAERCAGCGKETPYTIVHWSTADIAYCEKCCPECRAMAKPITLPIYSGSSFAGEPPMGLDDMHWTGQRVMS